MATADSNEQYDLEGLAELVDANPGSPEFPALAEAARRTGDAVRAHAVAAAGLDAAPARLAGRVALGLALLDLGRAEEAREALSSILDGVLEPHLLSEAVLEEGDAEPLAEPLEDSRADLTEEVMARTASAPLEEMGGEPLMLSEPVAELTDAEGVGDDELEEAFAAAEPQVDEMISPNRMAEQVLLDHAPVSEDELTAVAADEAETLDEAEGEDARLDLDEAGVASPLFRTATMAALLDRQGDVAGAEAIRRALSQDPEPDALPRAVDAAIAPEWPAPELSMDEAVVDESAVADAMASSREVAGRARILDTLERWLQNIQRGGA